MVSPHRIMTATLAILLVTAGAALARPAWPWGTLPPGAETPPVPADNPMTAEKVALGRRLFYDARLSLDETIACGDCHQQGRGFSDGERTHRGVDGTLGFRNAPGLANVAWRSPLTWADATVRTLEQQALVPVTGDHPIEMGMKGREAELVGRLAADTCYPRQFAAAFPAGGGRFSLREVTAALAAFERTMVSSDSRYDRFRAGDASALSPEARRGEAQFRAAGCTECHGGPDLTDNKLHYVGTGAAGTGYGTQVSADDAESFRTPPLRNVAVTGPWLHNGSMPTIESAIRAHAASALPRVDMPALLAFLDAQTDDAFLRDKRLGPPEEACPR